jgi:hypothetical protein
MIQQQQRLLARIAPAQADHQVGLAVGTAGIKLRCEAGASSSLLISAAPKRCSRRIYRRDPDVALEQVERVAFHASQSGSAA